MQFQILLSLVAGAHAAAYGYPAVPVNSTSSALPYGASSTPAYPVYSVSSSTPAGYPVSTPAGYPVSSKPPTYVTRTTTALTTYCPGPTQVVQDGVTYTVTTATTLTITNCKCTVVEPVTTPVAPASTKPAPSHYPVNNGTIPHTSAAGTGVPPSKTSTLPVFTGAANALQISGLMGGVLAVAALF
ncbi:hypothetical protein B0J11DRAFT_86270 [Dendryphion nanum]|uniref:Uncharacterized protein n=1 Tax=Dendryphion nanum TaxID=256645 RepID=A0A9P9DHL1_9PLEO|nr:hypothetical protein B0J11DRAFT_86270 [Dendryphion nanum]